MVGLDELSNFETGMYQALAESLGVSLATLTVILTIISIWALVWKGFALWKASKKNHWLWFIVLLVVNTVGILEILYIFVFSKIRLSKSDSAKKSATKKKR